jgi:hypothetical protein
MKYGDHEGYGTEDSGLRLILHETFRYEKWNDRIVNNEWPHFALSDTWKEVLRFSR